MGSDLLRPALQSALDSGAAHGLRLELEGSRGGLEDLRAGRADLAVLVFEPDEVLPEEEFCLIPFAYQVAVFAVIETNPITQVSFSQLGGLFGDKEPTNHRQWGTLGATGAWALKGISLNLVDDPDSLAVDLFKSTVLHVPELKTTINRLASVDEMLRRVSVDDTCIGLFPRPLCAGAGVHVLLVARSDRDVAFGPTPENVHAGDYALRLPFYLVFKRELSAKLAPVVAGLLGDPVAAALADAGFMAVPANARTEAVAKLVAR